MTADRCRAVTIDEHNVNDPACDYAPASLNRAQFAVAIANVKALHAQGDLDLPSKTGDGYCLECGGAWPCATVTAIAAAFLDESGDA